MLAAKIYYFCLLVLTSIAALVLYYYGDSWDWVSDVLPRGVCEGLASGETHCLGIESAFRLSFAAAMFFLGAMVSSMFSTEAHLGWWGLKLLLYLAVIAGSFCLPAGFAHGYADFAVGVAVIFIVMMAIVFIDMAYSIQDWMAVRIETRQQQLHEELEEVGCCSNGWGWLYLLMVVLLQAGSLAALGTMYHLVASKGKHCGVPVMELSMTLITGLAYTVLSPLDCLTPHGEGRGLLTPSVVFAYATWLAWTAIGSSPDTDCNPMAGHDTTASVVTGIIIAAVSLGYVAFSTASAVPGLVMPSPQLPPEATAGGGAHAGSPLLDSDEEAADAALGIGGSNGYTAVQRGGGRASYGEDLSGKYPPSSAGGVDTVEPLDASMMTDAEGGAGALASPQRRPITLTSPSGGVGRAGNALAPGADELGSPWARQPERTRYASDEEASVRPGEAPEPDHFWVFHLVMMAAAVYAAMVISNWQLDPEASNSEAATRANLWAKIGGQWLCIALYVWTLLAPACCPGRDFGGA